VRVDIQDFGPGISVENRSQIFEPFREILNASCFDAEVAYSAAQAVDVALERCPNVVIADVVTPEKTRIELAIILSSICPAARILLMSGQASTATLMRDAARDGYDFELLAKPLPPLLLLEKLRT